MADVANQDTPHKDRTVTSTGPYIARSVRKPTLQEFRQRLVSEMTNRSVPLSLEDFLNSFLPVTRNQKPKRALATLFNKFSTLESVKTDKWNEDAIANTFVSGDMALICCSVTTDHVTG